jgi:hypothetical protein
VELGGALLVTHPQHEWAGAHLDACDVETMAPVECKVPRSYNYRRWMQEGIPERATLQTFWQSHLMGARYQHLNPGILWVFNADAWEGERTEVPQVPTLFDAIINEVGEWRERHLVAGLAPAALSPEVELPDLPRPKLGDKAVRQLDPVLDGPVAKAVDLMARAEVQYLAAKRTRKRAQEVLKERMGTEQAVELPGVARVYYREQEGSLRLNEARLRELAPLDPEKVLTALVEFSLELGAGSLTAEDLRERLRSDLAEMEMDISQAKVQGKGTRPFRVYPQLEG